jgi:hypothetical protein
MNLHSSITYNSFQVEKAKMSINWQIDESDMIIYLMAIKNKEVLQQRGWALKMLCLVKEASHTQTPHTL